MCGSCHGPPARSPCLGDFILARLPGEGMGLQRALPDMVSVKPVAGGAASIEGAPSHAPVILVGANLFHCPSRHIRASVLLVWAWRGMPSGRIVYFRKSNNFNPNNQTFVKFFYVFTLQFKNNSLSLHTGCPIAHNMPGRLSGGLVCRGWHGSPLSLSGCAGGCQAVILPHLPVPRGHIRPPHGIISLYHGDILVHHTASSPCITGAYPSTTRPYLPVPWGHILPPHGLIHVSRVWAQGISETILFLNIPHCGWTRCKCGNH